MTVRCGSCHTGLADRLVDARRCPVCYGPIHVPADTPPQDGGEVDVQIPAGNASTAEWRSFARAQNPPFDVELKTRDELRGWFRSVHGGADEQTDVQADVVDSATLYDADVEDTDDDDDDGDEGDEVGG